MWTVLLIEKFVAVTCDLNLKSDSDNRYQAEPETKDGFSLMWCGAGSTHGVREGKVAFQVKVTVLLIRFRRFRLKPLASRLRAQRDYFTNFHFQILAKLPVNLPFEDSTGHHDIRVGWSARKSFNPPLGEAAYDYAMCGCAKKANANKFTDYGRYIEVNDVITCMLDLDSQTISYWINEESLGDAFLHIPTKQLKLEAENMDESFLSDSGFREPDLHKDTDDVLIWYPHISVRNIKYEANFGQQVRIFHYYNLF
jgi:hypothetical protein